MDFSLYSISPELILTAGAILTLAAGLFSKERSGDRRIGLLSPEVVCVATLLAALVPSVMMFTGLYTCACCQTLVFNGLLAVDGLAIFFKMIAIVSTIIVALLAVDYFRKVDFHRGEFYALLVFATLAINLLAASNDLIMIYLSLEFLSITSYILVGYLKRDSRSSEAAMKYFIFGSVAAAVMLYGMTILYGLTGETNLAEIATAFRSGLIPYPLLYLAMVFALVGFGFKIAMAPFHQWAPDAYEGSPTPITAFLSVGSKAAGFAVLVRVLTSGFAQDIVDWTPVIILLCAVTMTVGNLIAIPQTNIKRMLAYSSIAQAGYILLGIAAMGRGASLALTSVLLYLLVYLFMNLGAFAVVTILSARIGDRISDYAGLIKRAPIAAACMAVFMLSLAGIPPTAGFIGKLYLFMAALQANDTALLWLAVIAGVNTIVAVYYYFNVVRMMFFIRSEDNSPIVSSIPVGFVIALTTAVTFIVLFYPEPFIRIAQLSASTLTGM
ncbi:MAG: NADH-quinone oxidoreductase subunit N [Armatimonadetes bacterium]|nr:NADH-quinone oxidoreductase subunit N [Armatimonadota bacterium]